MSTVDFNDWYLKSIYLLVGSCLILGNGPLAIWFSYDKLRFILWFFLLQYFCYIWLMRSRWDLLWDLLVIVCLCPWKRLYYFLLMMYFHIFSLEASMHLYCWWIYWICLDFTCVFCKGNVLCPLHMWNHSFSNSAIDLAFLKCLSEYMTKYSFFTFY